MAALVAVIIGAVAIIKTQQSAGAAYGEFNSVDGILHFLTGSVLNRNRYERKRSAVCGYLAPVAVHTDLIRIERGKEYFFDRIIVDRTVFVIISSYRYRRIFMIRHTEMCAELILALMIKRFAVIYFSAIAEFQNRQI